MQHSEIHYKPIGRIHSPYTTITGTPIQPNENNANGKIEIYHEFAAGLKDLEAFSHVIVLYHFDRIKKVNLLTKPFMDETEHGIFATRSPGRPNAIGLSVLPIEKIEGNFIYVNFIDIVDQTPVLDVKPYVPQFDHYDTQKIGWLNDNVHKYTYVKDDGRFI